MDQAIPIHQNPQNINQINGHILVISSPLEGHFSPLLKLSNLILKQKINVTFLTTDAARMRIAGRIAESGVWNQGLRMISIPKTLEHEGKWMDQEKLHLHIRKVMPRLLEDLLSNKTSQSPESDGGGRITGVIVDSPFAWMMGIPKKIGVKVALYWASSVGCLALVMKIPELVESKFISDDGTPLKSEPIALLPNLPPITPTDLLWYFPADQNMQKAIFYISKDITNHMKEADWILTNNFHELDPEIHTLASNILSIGPLQADGLSSSSLFSEDSSCLKWLNNFPQSSVIYAAFGSTSQYNQQQLEEIALGLELTGKPFLWVVRSDQFNESFTKMMKGYAARMTDRGKIVEWAPQVAVLAHPSTGCFLSHCGWNSVLESINMGVPLVCLPQFVDHPYVRTCVCDGWRIGIQLSPDADGLISRFEIKTKIKELMCNEGIKMNALRLKDSARKSISEGGSSWFNLKYLVEQMKG